MDTGCPDCDKTSLVSFNLCPKHRVEHLKWVADVAQKKYEEYKAKLEERIKQNVEADLCGRLAKGDPNSI